VLADRGRIAHEHRAPEALLHALQYYPRRYHYDGLCVDLTSAQDRHVWGPTGDSIILLEAVRRELLDEPVAVLTDLGAGSGFIGLWFASHGQAGRVQVIERSEQAAHCIRQNLNVRPPTSSVQVFDGSAGEETTRSQLAPADVLVCNPPYIPPITGTAAAPSPFAGVELLLSVLETPERYLVEGGRAYVVVSSLSAADERVRTQVVAQLAAGHLVEVARRTVPMKVGDLLNDRPWLAFLESSGGLRREADDRYEWWHEVIVYRRTFPVAARVRERAAGVVSERGG